MLERSPEVNGQLGSPCELALVSVEDTNCARVTIRRRTRERERERDKGACVHVCQYAAHQRDHGIA